MSMKNDHKGNMHDHHQHGGFSTQGSFDVKKILELAGIEKGHHILDAGCGDGYISILMSRIVGPNGRIYAFDSHETSVNILEKRLEYMKISNVSAERRNIAEELPLEDDSLDMVIASNVIHGLILNGEMEGFVENLERKMKEGSTLALVEYKKELTGKGPAPSERFSPDEIGEYLKRANLFPEMVMDVSPHHYLALFGKRYA